MKPIVLAVFLFVGCIVAESDFHSDLPPADLQKYFGVQVRENVPMYEVVSPVHMKGSRHRRSLLAAKEPLRYDLTAFGEDFKLHLEHNDHLIAPGCLVHFMQSNGTKKVRSCPTHEDDCYYHGASLAHNGSDVALSTCNGLHGLIRLPDRDHDLWIQPVEDRHADRVRHSTSGTLEQPHIIYKRAVEERHCATQGMPEVNQLVSEAESLARVRRGAGDKYAEMLLVADTTMAEHYKEKLREYLLTVANVAARVLLDRSIGTPLHFTVVKIQILDVDQPGLVINEDAEDTLDSFCTWQEQHNPRDDSNPQHYDGASLFTRKDIVHNGVRDTTGYATVSGMCGEKTRCSVNEDNGLGVGLTLAHETGHTLGMVHDGSGNNCDNGKNVMSSMGGGGHTAMMWSTCSRQAYTQFLGTTKAECLNDQPQSSIAMSKDLPGVVYDGDEQCEMYVGAGSTLCLGTNIVQGDECSHLVCFDPQQTGTCKGDSVPRLDGTMCGDRKYCMHGQCVDIGLNGPQPRNGGWSAWETEWSACSRECGGGVRVRRRKCDSPKPRLGGSDCPGSTIMAEMCNMQACKKSEEEFRADQCAMTDSIPVNGQRHHWVPVDMLGEQECELHCRVDGQRTVLLRHNNGKGWYQDGTTCASVTASFGRCVDGKCRSFGCDGKTGSQYQFDKCGVCGGQGNTCSKQSGTYNKGRKHEYVTFVTVPKGSTDVNIKNDNKFTQMSVKVAGKRLFSEDGGEADQSGIYTAEAIVVDYKSPSSGEESISISGPLPEPVEAQVWRKFDDSEFQGVAPQINFEYFVPSASQPTSNYQWAARNGACTKTCGGGVYNRIITCTRRGGGAQVDDHLCDLRQKPAMTGSACNNQACPPRWRTGQFGQCSKTCGGGQQTRAVDCVQARGGREEVVAAGSCPANSRPSATQRCNINPCPAIWVSGDWSACSLTCGKGVHTRTVQCVKDDGSRQKVADSQCASDSKPAPTEACVNAVCSPDITGDACKDTDGTCASYGLTMCQDYASFAKESCMKHCAFCTPDGTVGAVCENKNKDCDGYGNSICAGEYTEWARSNCAKLCGYCGGSVGGGGGATCEDKNDQCSGYGESVCTGDYADWAKENCAKMCGVCGGTGTVTTDNNNSGTGGGGAGAGGSTGSTAASGACEDKSGDCGGYGQSVCSGQYADWAKDNCAKYCGHCTTGATGATGGAGGGSVGGTSTGAGRTTAPTTPSQTLPTTTVAISTTTTPTPTTITTTTPTTTSPSPTTTLSSNCKDTSTNCAAFGKSFCTQSTYIDWAKTNCARYCNRCEENGVSTVTMPTTTTTKPTSALPSNCLDVANNCQQYGTDFCSKPAYVAWAKENCARYCNLCGRTTAPLTPSQSMPTTTVATTTTPTLTTITTTTPTTTATTTTTTISSNCKDTNTNCAAFGKSFCTQSTYIDWAKTNCARYCNLCEENSVSTVSMPTTTTAKPKSALPSNCLDVASNCQQYGTDFCSKPAYVAWAKENCARYCNLCEDNHAVETVAVAVATTPKPALTQASTTEFAVETIAVAKVTTPKPAPTQTATEAVDASCMDAVDNCDQYGSSFCSQADYVDWAKENCARHCQFCVSKSLPGEEVCVDKLESCAQYDKEVCKDQQYKEWAEVNCAAYCGICGQGEVKVTTTATQTTTTAQTTTTPSPTTTAATKKSDNVVTSPSSACQDKVSNCAAFGQTFCTDERYADFAKDNCQRHCKFCGASTPVAEGKDCKDEVDNCVSYDKSVCHSTDYEEWSRTNCAKFCGFCSEEGSIAEQTTQSKENVRGTSQSGFCKDVYDNCESYGESVCTGPYEGWAAQNCQKFCDLCGETGSGGMVGSSSGRGTGDSGKGSGNSGDNTGIGTPTNSDSGAACEDKNDQCSGYGASVCTGDYADWAKDNCAKMCGVCGGTGTSTSNNNSGGGAVAASSSTGNCVDVSADCAGYGAGVCTSYADWAAANCQKSCNKCGNRRRRSVLAPPPPRPLCNNVLTDPFGSLSLIGRPVDTSCSQIIVAPIGSRIQLSFTDLRISCKEGDWLEVREEGGKKKDKKMTRDQCDQPAPVQWTTTGHIVTIKLSVATPGHGYNMSYRVEKSPEVPHGCDRLLTNPSGAVASPGFPAPYRHNKLCLTTIVAPPNFTIRLNFDLFRLDSEKCGKDTVTVYDEEYGNKDVFCGTWPDLTWQSKGNRVKVVFASDQMKNGPGFLASYKFIAPW